MDPKSLQELERLYGLAFYATATTNFYNQVYKYVGFIKQSETLTEIIKQDDADLHEYDLEKNDTVPKQQDGEGDLEYFIKTMRHMDSGEEYFLSYLFFKLEHHIYDYIDWYYSDNFYSEEATIMLHGRKRRTIFEKIKKYINRHNIIGYDRRDFNKVYIDNFSYWKDLLKKFHSKLHSKLDGLQVDTIQQEKNVALFLQSNGQGIYLNQPFKLSPAGKDYLLLSLLIQSPNYSVHYSDIALKLFSKNDSKVVRRDIQQQVKKLKLCLGIRASDDDHKLIENAKGWGYRLNLQPDQEAILKP